MATKLATNLFVFGSACYLHTSKIPLDDPDQNIMPLVCVLINSQCAVHFDVYLGGEGHCFFVLRGNVWFARRLTKRCLENLEEASGSGGRSDEGGGREGGEEKEEEEEKEEKEEGEERSRGGGGGGQGAGGKTFIE